MATEPPEHTYIYNWVNTSRHPHIKTDSHVCIRIGPLNSELQDEIPVNTLSATLIKRRLYITDRRGEFRTELMNAKNRRAPPWPLTAN